MTLDLYSQIEQTHSMISSKPIEKTLPADSWIDDVAVAVPVSDVLAISEIYVGGGRKPNSVSLQSRDGNHSSGPWITPGI